MALRGSKETGRILVVDDEEGVRTFIAESLELDGHDVVQAADGQAALRLARAEPFDVVTTDLRMPVLDGMGLVRALRVEQPDVEVIVLTAFGDVATAVEAMKLGAFDYLEKPLPGPGSIRTAVDQALARRKKIASTKRLSSTIGARPALSFGAPAMAPVTDAITKVAKTNATVLLQGESGSGKEVAARMIHELSPRSKKPFVAMNCAVLTENLLESELFGHEKGAFTGAHVQRRGRIELADGGTFFLDEVAELHPSLQAKLLRVLEEKEFERLGGGRPIRVDVRWVAATHRDLRDMVRGGTFREDLYHRLAVFPIRLPPLRERREDIAPLARLLLTELAQSGGRPPPELHPDALAGLVEEAWPGNVRELKNALERAMILADGEPLQTSHFSFERAAPRSRAIGATPVTSPEAQGASERESASEEDDGAALDGSLSDMEQKAIERALAAVNGNRRAAAAKLGIGLRTLYDKLKRYGIS